MHARSKSPTVLAHLNRTVLSGEGLDCTLLALAPAEQTAGPEPHADQDHVLFVIEGSVNVRVGELTFLVNHDEALHIAAGRPYTVAAVPSGWAKILRVDFTRKTVVEAPLYTV